MVSITLSVSEEIRKMMKKFPEVNWSGLVKKAIVKEITRRKLKEELLEDIGGEKEFIDWSVGLGRKAKKGRFKKVLDENNY